MADYIHLNPARAKLAGGKAGGLAGYRWSSLACYAKGKGPPWLEMDRVLQSFELAELRKGDERKAMLAAVLRRRTAVATQWIAQRLAMGHPGSVSRQVGIVKSDRKLLKKLNEHEKLKVYPVKTLRLSR